MIRSLLVVAGAMAALAPMVCAQSAMVCVSQAQKGHKMRDDSDAQGVAYALTALKLPGGDSISAVSLQGVSSRDEGAAARRRKCAFIADVWRDDVGASTPVVDSAGVNGLDAATEPGSSSSSGSTVLEYSLRETGSNKKLAHGEAD